MAILAYDIRLHGGAIAHRSNVPQIESSGPELFDGQLAQFDHAPRRGVEPHVEFAVADLGGATWEDEILRVDRLQDIAGSNVLRLHQVLIHIDHDLTLLAAVGEGNHRSRNGDQLR